MKEAGNAPSTGPALPPPKRAPRRLWIALGLIVLALAALALGSWLRWTPSPASAEPIIPDLAGVDQEVVEVIQKARDEVMRNRASAAAWGRLGEVLLAHEFNRDANRCFREAENLDSAEPAWPYLQGLNLVITDPEAGIPCLERAVQKGGEGLVKRQLVLAEILLERGRLDEAQALLRQAIAAEPNNLRARFGLGRLALAQQNRREALQDLILCKDDVHTRKRAHLLCAEAYAQDGDSERARSEQRQAADLPPDQPWPDPAHERVVQLRRGLRARLQSVSYLMQANRIDEAIQLLNQTLQRYPASLESWMRLGQVWERLNKLDRAQPCYQQVADLAPEMPEAWFRLACVQARLHSRDAEDSFQKAIRFRPHHAEAHFVYGQWLKGEGKADAARAEFQEALRCRPDYEPARAALSHVDGKKSKPR